MKALVASLFLFAVGCLAQSPYNQSIFPAQSFTATAQTGTTIQLNGGGNTGTIGSSFGAGTITVTGTSITTVTFAVMGSSDNGATFYALPITPLTAGASPAATATATASGLYQVSLVGITHIQFVTSGTFTATGLSLRLTVSPNVTVSRSSGAAGGGVTPSTQFKFGQYNAPGTGIVGSNIATDSTGSNLTVPGAISSLSVNGATNCLLSSSPITCLAAANLSRASFPPGTYSISAALSPGSGASSGLDLDCTFSGIDTGTLITPASGNAIFGIQNSGASLLTGVAGRNCGIDLTHDSSAIGGFDFTNISWSNQVGSKVFTPSTGSMVGYQFNAGTLGSYWNSLFQPVVQSLGSNASSNNHIAYLFNGLGNSNSLFGASGPRNATFLDIESGNAIGVFGGGTDSWKQNCLKFGAVATYNTVDSVRCETSQASTAGATNATMLYFDPASYNNSAQHIYSGSSTIDNAVSVNDLSGQNDWAFSDSGGQFAKRMFSSRFAQLSMGINIAPYLYLAQQGLEVHGELDVDNYIWNKKPGDFQLDVSSAYPQSTYASFSYSSPTITFNATNVFAAGARVQCVSTAGFNTSGLYVVGSSNGTSWSATSPTETPTGTDTGYCYETDNAINSISVAAGTITFTGLNSWAVSQQVNVEAPTGAASFLSGKYTVGGTVNSGNTGNTGWTVTAPTQAVTQVNANVSAGTIQFLVTNNRFLSPMVINVVLTGTWSALSGQYTVTGSSGAFTLCTYSGGTDTSGAQSTTGTAQLYTLASTTVLATQYTIPTKVIYTDQQNNIHIQAPNGTVEIQGLISVNNSIVPTNPAVVTIGNTSEPLADMYVGNAASQDFHFDTSALAHINAVHVPDSFGNDTIVAGAASATSGKVVQYIDQSGSQHYVPSGVAPAVSVATGDLACALAADTTIGATAITAVSSTAINMTYTMASVPAYFYVGQIVSSQGNTTTGYNAAPLTVASTTSTTVTVTSSLNPGAGTGGGTLSLYCSNQSTNAVLATPFVFANNYSVPAATVATGSTYQLRGQMASFSSATAAGVLFEMEYGSTVLYAQSSYMIPSNSLTGQSGELALDVTALSPSLLVSDPIGLTISSATTWATANNSTRQPVTVSTGSTQALALKAAFSAATAGNAVLLYNLIERP